MEHPRDKRHRQNAFDFARELHARFGHLPKAEQDRELALCLRQMIEGSPRGRLRQVARQLARSTEAAYRARRTVLMHWSGDSG